MSFGDESSSEETGNETGEDIGILEEAWDDEDGLQIENSSEDDLVEGMKDPDWNANMEEEVTDSSDDDELGESEFQDNTSQNVRYIFIRSLTHSNKKL